MNTTNKTTEQIIESLNNNKALQKNIKKLSHYTSEDFLRDAQRYIKAIRERRMFCVVHSVSSSGMSRNLSFYAHELNTYTNNTYNLLNYFCFFKALGYSEAKQGFRVSGCGMDMIFHTNYSNCHNLKNLGLLSDEDCEVLAQQTPSCI